MLSKGFNKGVIKIDVEGYEEIILIGIANSIPLNTKAIILFESWDSNFNLLKITKAFNREVIVKKIKRYTPWGGYPKLIKFAFLFLNPFFKTKITPINDESLIGDLILEIK